MMVLRSAAQAVARRVKRVFRSTGRRPGDPTSFGTLVDRRQAWLYDHLPGDVARYQSDLITKVAQRAMAERLDLPVAHLYLARVTLADAFAYAETHELDGFVVKPNSSYSARGCRAVVSDGAEFRDLLTGTRGTLRRQRELAHRDYHALGRPDDWLLEELLRPPDGSDRLCDDLKVYCVGGRAELIVHKSHAVGRGSDIQVFTPDWTPVNTGMEDRSTFRTEAPERGDAAVALAERASRALCYPFIRVDTYDTDRGVVLGELTPGPGRRHLFNDEWNAYMVRRWHEAANAIVGDIASGRVTPLGPPSADATGSDVAPPGVPAAQNRPTATTQSER